MNVLYPKVTGALCAKMARGLSGQDGNNGMVLVISPDKPSQNLSRGGVASTIMSRVYKSPDDLIVEEQPHRKYVVRRLTPLECCRLQGFPDWWTDGVEGSGTAQYKMWGNGIALPCAYDVMHRIAKEFERGNKHGIDDSGTT